MKKSINKLSLNKSTISNLNASEMNEKIGGIKQTNATVCCGLNTRLNNCLTKTCPIK